MCRTWSLRAVSLLGLLAAANSARSETVLQASRIRDFLFLNQVYLNEKGPYRMMVDTGNSWSTLRPAVANQIGVRPVNNVEVESASGVRRVAAAILNSVRVGSLLDENVKIVIADVKL